MTDQLAAAKELVEVLEQLEALAIRQGELLTALGYPGPNITAQMDRPKAKRGRPPAAKDRTSAEILADPYHRTPEERAKIEGEAWQESYALADPVTRPQLNMIFGLLSKEFGIKDEQEMKQIIIGIVASQHDGHKLDSIGKELSKAWAGGVIDYLQAAKPADVVKYLREPF